MVVVVVQANVVRFWVNESDHGSDRSFGRRAQLFWEWNQKIQCLLHTLLPATARRDRGVCVTRISLRIGYQNCHKCPFLRRQFLLKEMAEHRSIRYIPGGMIPVSKLAQNPQSLVLDVW